MTLLTPEELETIFEAGPSYERIHVARLIARAQLRKVIEEIEEIYRLNHNCYGPCADLFMSGILVWKEQAKKEMT